MYVFVHALVGLVSQINHQFTVINPLNF